MIFTLTDIEIYDKERRLLQKTETAETDKATPNYIIQLKLMVLNYGICGHAHNLPTIMKTPNQPISQAQATKQTKSHKTHNDSTQLATNIVFITKCHHNSKGRCR